MSTIKLANCLQGHEPVLDGLAFPGAKTALDKQRLLFADNFFHGGDFVAHGIFLSVQLANQMRPAAEQALAFRALGGGGEGEFVRQLGGAGQIPGGEDGLQRADGGVHRVEARRGSAERRKWNQFQRRLGDDAEQAFRADKQPVQIEAGLVFVRAPAEPDDAAAGQNDFEAEDVIAGDAVFEAARAAGVGGDVAADEVVRAAGGVGRIKQAAPLDGLLKFFRVHPRLDDGDEIGGIDFADAVHALQSRARCRRARARSRRRSRGPRRAASRESGAGLQISRSRRRFWRSGAGRRRRAGARRTICRRRIFRAWRVQEKFRRAGFF